MTRLAMLFAGTALSITTPAFASEASLKSEIALLKAQLAAQSSQLERLEAATQAHDNLFAHPVLVLGIAAP